MSSKLIVYRYDPRVISVGEIMLPDLNLTPTITSKNNVVEEGIKRFVPALADIRAISLYTWKSKVYFERILERHGKSGLRDKYFYELEVDRKDIHFVGNLIIHGEAADYGNTHPLFEKEVLKYAAGCNILDNSEYIEILVSKAKVLKRYNR